MISVTAAQRAALRTRHKRVLICKLKLGETFYYISNEDLPIVFEGNTYAPGYLKDVGEIELTGVPKTDDTNIVIDGTDSIFFGLVQSQAWMNQPLIITSLIYDLNNALILSKVAYDGLISDFDIDTKTEYELTLKVSSIWKDFEKTAGIKTNYQSQSRHYPEDTAFEQSARATKDSPWGKESKTSTSSSTNISRFQEIEF
jgi:hypothetical protein